MRPILLIIQLLFCISALGQIYNSKERFPDSLQINYNQNVKISDQTGFITEILLISDDTSIDKKNQYYIKGQENILFPSFLMRNDTILGHNNTLRGKKGLENIKLINCNNITVNNKSKDYNKFGLDIENVDNLYIVFYENKIIIRKKQE